MDDYEGCGRIKHGSKPSRLYIYYARTSTKSQVLHVSDQPGQSKIDGDRDVAEARVWHVGLGPARITLNRAHAMDCRCTIPSSHHRRID